MGQRAMREKNMNDTLPCMNCKQPVATTDGKLFSEVFLCVSCHTQAKHFWEKLDKELRYLQVMAKESIRLALLEGKFNLPEGPSGTPSRRDVLEEALRMEESRERKERPWRQPQPSTVTTPLPAPTKVAVGDDVSTTR